MGHACVCVCAHVGAPASPFAPASQPTSIPEHPDDTKLSLAEKTQMKRSPRQGGGPCGLRLCSRLFGRPSSITLLPRPPPPPAWSIRSPQSSVLVPLLLPSALSQTMSPTMGGIPSLWVRPRSLSEPRTRVGDGLSGGRPHTARSAGTSGMSEPFPAENSAPLFPPLFPPQRTNLVRQVLAGFL